jgi:hypothetical protein
MKTTKRTMVAHELAEVCREQRLIWRAYIHASTTPDGESLQAASRRMSAPVRIALAARLRPSLVTAETPAAKALALLDPWLRQADEAARQWQRWMTNQALWSLFSRCLGMDILHFNSIQQFRRLSRERVRKLFLDRDNLNPASEHCHWIARRLHAGESVDLCLARFVAAHPDACRLLSRYGLPHKDAPVAEFRQFINRLSIANANSRSSEFPEAGLRLAAQNDQTRLELQRLGYQIPGTYAPTEEFTDFFAALCEDAATPKPVDTQTA